MNPSSLLKTSLLLMLTASLALGCRPDDQRTESVNPHVDTAGGDVTPVLLATLDSGNVAYRNDDYEEALEYYERATEMAPDVASGWFGVYMVHQSMGNREEADEALEKAQSLAPGATLIHPTTADTVGEGGRT